MKHVGFIGVLRLTTQIILTNSKHFLCFTALLALPNALNLAFFPPSSPTAAARSISSLFALVFHGRVPPPPDDNPQPQSFPLTLLLTSFIFAIFFTVITHPFLTFSVSRACLNKSLAIKGSLLAIPRSALNLLLTVLCLTSAFFGFCIAMVLLMVAVAAVLNLLGASPTIFVVVWSLGILGGVVYLAIAWSLASTVAIMEEKKRGWEAMQRSRDLLDGRSRWVALGLAVVYGGLGMCLLPIANVGGASAVWRWSCFVVSVILQALVGLWSMASTVVLYLSCRVRLNESLETLIAISPQFGPPLDSSPSKYADLETATINVSTP